MTRHNALSALFGIFGAILALSVVGSMQADAASLGGATALSQTAGFSESTGNGFWLKLDTGNDPLTGTLSLTGASGVNAIEFATNNSRLDLGAGATDYLFSDGTNVNAAGGFVAVGALTVLGTNISAGTTDIRVNLFNSGGDVLVMDGLDVTGPTDLRDSIANSTSSSSCTANNQAACTNDDMVVDGSFSIEESAIPTVPLNYGTFWFASDNTAHAITGDGVDHTISLVETFHAELKDADNTDAFGVSAALNFECYHTSGLVGDDLVGFTFDAGGGGTSFPIASIADGGGGEIAVTTTGAHGLAVGDIVSQANLTDATYEGVFVVNTINSSTIYEVTAAFTATDTGTMNQCASLVASTGSAGDYLVTWTASATGVTNNQEFDLELFVEAAGENTTVREQFGMAGLFSNPSNSTIITIADGDHLSLGIANQDSAGDIIVRQLTIVMTRL